MHPVPTAVIGVGHLGQHHARIVHELPETTLVAVVDSDLKRAQEIGERHGVSGLQDYQELPDTVEAVSIVVPTVKHHEVARYFLEKGVHVLVEKPVTAKVSEAQDLANLSASLDLVLQVGHIERFNPAWLAVQEKIIAPQFLEIHRLAPFKGRSTDISVVLDLMIHDLDMVLTIVDRPIKDIRSSGVAVIGPNEDIVNSRIEFEGGCVANVTASRISQKEMRRFRIFQPHGYLVLDYAAQSGEFYEMVDGQVQTTRMQTEPEQPLKLELKGFIECIQKKTPPKVSIQHGKLALETAMHIQSQIRDV